jgi:hypothetical protein
MNILEYIDMQKLPIILSDHLIENTVNDNNITQ